MVMGLSGKLVDSARRVDRPEATVATFALKILAGAFGQCHERRFEIDFLFLE